MVIANLDLVGIPIFPAETQTALIIYANAVLARSISSQPLKPVARRHSKVIELDCVVQLLQLPFRDSLNALEAARASPFENGSSVIVMEAADHCYISEKH